VYILGINAYHGDSAACLVADGKLVAAIEEERIRRTKHWAGFPTEAIRFCLDYAGLTLKDINHVAIGRNPSAHLHKKILFSLQHRPSFSSIKSRLANMGKLRDLKSCQELPCARAGRGSRRHQSGGSQRRAPSRTHGFFLLSLALR